MLTILGGPQSKRRSIGGFDRSLGTRKFACEDVDKGMIDPVEPAANPSPQMLLLSRQVPTYCDRMRDIGDAQTRTRTGSEPSLICGISRGSAWAV